LPQPQLKTPIKKKSPAESQWILTGIRIFEFFLEADTSEVDSFRIFYKSFVKSKDGTFSDVWSRVVEHGDEFW